MRSSAIVAAVALAAVAPAFAAPVASNPSTFARRATSSTSSVAPTTTAVVPADASEAISLGTVASIASFAAPVIGGIIDHFKNNGNQQQRRDALEIEALLARDTADESGAIKLSTVASIGSFVAPVIGGIINHFTNNGNPQQRREALELQELLAREPSRLGDAATIASFASTAVGAVQDFIDSHKKSRDVTDESGAIKLGDVANIASIGNSLIGAAESLFNNHKREDVTDESGALKLGDIANIASIGSSLVSAGESIFNNHKRADPTDESGALKLGDIANIASIGNSLISAGEDIFGSHKREDVTDESGALKLGDVANIASIGSSIVSAVHNIYEGQKRQDTVDESGALKLGDVANIASIGSSVIGAVENIFNQRDESGALFLGHGPVCFRAPCVGSGSFNHVLPTAVQARDDTTDESGALKLGDVANIASIGSSIVSAVHNLFSGQKRDFMLEELLARSMGSLNDLD